MRNRKVQSLKEKKEIVINNDDQSYSCLLTDISASGISVTGGHFIPTYKEIEVIMEIEGEKVAMKGPPAFLAFVKTWEKNIAK
jgi:hypothetical protein